MREIHLESTNNSSLPSEAGNVVRRRGKINTEGLPGYLTSIISSPLNWIKDDAEKEQIWEATSQRLSERSGRTAIGAISRTFSIRCSPVPTIQPKGEIDHDHDANRATKSHTIEIQLHEPTYTADNLGLKTWASSYLLAKRLPLLRSTLPEIARDSYVLELGSGTGLVGIAVAAILSAHVLLTDLPEIVPNLEYNVQQNSVMIRDGGGEVGVGVLDWSDPASFHIADLDNFGTPHRFPLIFAADTVYSSEHSGLLVQAIEYHLSRAMRARVVVEIPLREGFDADGLDFQSRMTRMGLCILDEGEEVGYDDWTSDAREHDPIEVRCWWSVWGWK